MAEISIKSHTRRGKGGKTVQVRGYTRRVGRKGVHSPKRSKSSVKPGDELIQKVEMTVQPKLTKEELAERKEALRGFQRAEAERKALGLSWGDYASMKRKKTSNAMKVQRKSSKKVLDSFEKLEDKISRFVKKYSGKTYKRQL